MGLTVGPSYTTEYGIVISALYLSIDFMRFMIDSNGNIQCTFTIQGFNSLVDKKNGRQSIHLPQNLAVITKSTRAGLLNKSSIYEFAYTAIKDLWVQTGYEINDVYEHGQIVIVDPVVVEPTVVEPATIEPVTVEPTVEPVTVEPVTVEPVTVEPVTVEPTVEPATVEPIVESVTVEPATVEPIVEPATVEPTVESVTVEPATVEPIVEPATVEPTTTEPST